METIDNYKKKKNRKIIDFYLKKYNAIKHENSETFVHCNCGRWVNVKDGVWIHPINVNYFDWWAYQLLDKDERKGDFKTKLVINKKKLPWAYIGYIPLFREIPYYLHKWFSKKDYVLSIECDKCECDEE